MTSPVHTLWIAIILKFSLTAICIWTCLKAQKAPAESESLLINFAVASFLLLMVLVALTPSHL